MTAPLPLMEEKEIYSEIELDFYPDKDSIESALQFLESLKLMAQSLNKSSEIALDGGAGFSWMLKVTAKGNWS